MAIRLDHLTQVMMEHHTDTLVDRSLSMLVLAVLQDQDIEEWTYVLNQVPGFINEVAVWIISAKGDIRYQIISDRIEELQGNGRQVYIH